jgi:hypothetical protein
MSRKIQKACVNPVFEKWIEEWKMDAVAKELQSRFTYTKVFEQKNKF